MDNKYIYNLDKAIEKDVNLLGGKGFYLGQLQKLKKDLDLTFEVPKATILSTDLWKEYSKNPKKTIKLLKEEIVPILINDFLPKNKKENYPLLSIRSGAPVSMPGMMDTVLNFGINLENIDSYINNKKENIDWAFDCLKRYYKMFGNIVLEIPKEDFENINHKKYTNKEDFEKDFSKIYKKHKKELPRNNLEEQLFLCIEAVLKSWNSYRAISYRDSQDIDHFMGTAVVIQKMVFGNLNKKSATSVIFTRDITTGENYVMGEYAVNAQGEDVVSGEENSNNLFEFSQMSSFNKNLYENIKSDVKKLEQYFKDVLDIELTIEDGKLYFLQSRVAKRTPQASVKIALDMYNEGLIDSQEVFNRIKVEDYLNLNTKKIDEGFSISADGIGLPASNGVIVGPVILDASHLDIIDEKELSNAILLAKETTPDDVPLMKEVGGIYTATGGVTSHAAVMARSLNKISVVGSNDLKIFKEGKTDQWYATIGGKRVDIGDKITIDGFNGKVWVGNDVPITDGQNNKHLLKLEDLIFEAYPLIRVVSCEEDIFSDKDTIFTTYKLDEMSFEKMQGSLFNAMEIMSDYQGDNLNDYVAIIDLRGTSDFASLFSGEEFIFSQGISNETIERKIDAIASYYGSKENFYIYLGEEYEKEFKEKVENLGFSVFPHEKLSVFKDNNKSFIKVIDNLTEYFNNKNKGKYAISGKNALLSNLKR